MEAVDANSTYGYLVDAGVEDIKAVPVHLSSSPLSQNLADISLLHKIVAEEMPDWLTAKYFDPAAERDSSQLPVKRDKEVPY